MPRIFHPIFCTTKKVRNSTKPSLGLRNTTPSRPRMRCSMSTSRIQPLTSQKVVSWWSLAVTLRRKLPDFLMSSLHVSPGERLLMEISRKFIGEDIQYMAQESGLHVLKA